ncbi:hypothetical protein EZS27_023828, partial [termite gut metagenome]
MLPYGATLISDEERQYLTQRKQLEKWEELFKGDNLPEETLAIKKKELYAKYDNAFRDAKAVCSLVEDKAFEYYCKNIPNYYTTVKLRFQSLLKEI